MKKLDITRKRFKAWLKENQDLTFEPSEPTTCPIAVFLGSGCDHNVEADYNGILVDDEEFPTPKWALRFMQDFDRLGVQKASAKSALELL